MRNRLFRKIGVWLGMFAILMATLAPTISQALVAVRSRAPEMSAHCTMPSMRGAMHDMHHGTMPPGASMSMRAAPDTGPSTPSAVGSADAMSMPMDMDHAMMMPGEMHPAGSHNMMSHGDACGYCSLLAHMPVMAVVQAPFAVTVWSIEHRVATRFEHVRRAEPLTFAQPRAPPVSS